MIELDTIFLLGDIVEVDSLDITKRGIVIEYYSLEGKYEVMFTSQHFGYYFLQQMIRITS